MVRKANQQIWLYKLTSIFLRINSIQTAKLSSTARKKLDLTNTREIANHRLVCMHVTKDTVTKQNLKLDLKYEKRLSVYINLKLKFGWKILILLVRLDKSH